MSNIPRQNPRPPFINATEIISNLLEENRRLIEIILKLTVPNYGESNFSRDVVFATEPLHYSEEEEDARWAEGVGLIDADEMAGILRGVGYVNPNIEVE